MNDDWSDLERVIAPGELLDMLLSLAARITRLPRNHVDVEDLAQDVMLKLQSALARGAVRTRTREGVVSWCYRTLKTTFIDRIRIDKPRTGYDETRPPDPPAGATAADRGRPENERPDAARDRAEQQAEEVRSARELAWRVLASLSRWKGAEAVDGVRFFLVGSALGGKGSAAQAQRRCGWPASDSAGAARHAYVRRLHWLERGVSRLLAERRPDRDELAAVSFPLEELPDALRHALGLCPFHDEDDRSWSAFELFFYLMLLMVVDPEAALARCRAAGYRGPELEVSAVAQADVLHQRLHDALVECTGDEEPEALSEWLRSQLSEPESERSDA